MGLLGVFCNVLALQLPVPGTMFAISHILMQVLWYMCSSVPDFMLIWALTLMHFSCIRLKGAADGAVDGSAVARLTGGGGGGSIFTSRWASWCCSPGWYGGRWYVQRRSQLAAGEGQACPLPPKTCCVSLYCWCVIVSIYHSHTIHLPYDTTLMLGIFSWASGPDLFLLHVSSLLYSFCPTLRCSSGDGNVFIISHLMILHWCWECSVVPSVSCCCFMQLWCEEIMLRVYDILRV